MITQGDLLEVAAINRWLPMSSREQGRAKSGEQRLVHQPFPRSGNRPAVDRGLARSRNTPSHYFPMSVPLAGLPLISCRSILLSATGSRNAFASDLEVLARLG
jgi:hypothetical protein